MLVDKVRGISHSRAALLEAVFHADPHRGMGAANFIQNVAGALILSNHWETPGREGNQVYQLSQFGNLAPLIYQTLPAPSSLSCRLPWH